MIGALIILAIVGIAALAIALYAGPAPKSDAAGAITTGTGDSRASASLVCVGPSPSPTIVGPSEAAVQVIGPEHDRVVTVGPERPTIIAVVGAGNGNVVTVGPQQCATVQIRPSCVVTVDLPGRGAWEEKNWNKSQQGNGRTVYEGEYCILDRKTKQPRRFRGRITVRNGAVEADIADPPAALRRHAKWACFTPHARPWYRLRWYRPAANVDEAILYVERVLDEAANG